jgi:hypothetical protein
MSLRSLEGAFLRAALLAGYIREHAGRNESQNKRSNWLRGETLS